MSNDIGHYILSLHVIDDNIKIILLKNMWKPPLNFKYLFSVHNKQGKEEKRFLGINILSNIHGLFIRTYCLVVILYTVYCF